MLRLSLASLALRVGLLVASPAMLAPLRCQAADDPPAAEPQRANPPAAAESTTGAAESPLRVVPPLRLSEPVREVLEPLFEALRTAASTRVTAETALASKANGAAIDVQRGTYQIVSKTPNQINAHLKGRDQRMRLVSDGKQLFTQLSPDAYVAGEAPRDMNAMLGGVAVPFGPFPEFVFAVTLAGIDPALGLLGGVQEVRIVANDHPLPAPHAAIAAHHLRGKRTDGVVWDLWIAKGDQPQPLRLDVDLTEMLVKMNQLSLPEGFTYVMETTFSHWETGVATEPETFQFQPPKQAKQYASLAEYFESLSTDPGPHPLLGQSAPALQGELLSGQEVQLKQHRGKAVVVLDFWATWCSPCVAALPVIREVAAEFEADEVVFYAVNVGEEQEAIEAFLKEQELEIPVLLDPDGRIASDYQAQAIPQTVLVGKDGRIEAVHIGFAGPAALRELLAQQLGDLIEGRTLLPAADAADKSDAEKP